MAEKQKPGIMMYFSPMLEAAEQLNMAQLGELFLAAMKYACPDIREIPQFDDPDLIKVWPFVKNLADRDENRYQKTSNGNRFSQFVRWYEHYRGRKPDINRQQWEEIGCPTWKEYEGSEYDSAAHQDPRPPNPDTNVENVYTNVENVSPIVSTDTNADTKSNERAKTYTTGVNVPDGPQPDGNEPGRREQPPLPLTKALRAWKEFQEEKYRPLTAAAEKSLMGLMEVYANRYCPESVAALVQESIGNQWKNIPWERLDRNPDEYQRRGGGGNGHSGNGRPANGGNSAETGWRLPTVDLDAENAD